MRSNESVFCTSLSIVGHETRFNSRAHVVQILSDMTYRSRVLVRSDVRGRATLPSGPSPNSVVRGVSRFGASGVSRFSHNSVRLLIPLTAGGAFQGFELGLSVLENQALTCGQPIPLGLINSLILVSL